MKVIKIGAIWCGSCIAMKNKWKEIEKDYDLDVVNLDYDIDEEEVEKYNIGTVLPVAILLDDKGSELERIIGEKNKQDIIDIIRRYK